EDATIDLSKTADTVSVGSSTTINVTMNSLNGFTDQFTFSCPALPADLSCTFNPPSGQLPANANLATALTLRVNSRPAATFLNTPNNARSRESAPAVGSAIALIFLIFAAAFLTIAEAASRAQRTVRWAIPAFVLTLAFIIAACGGGGSSVSNP